jgi:hypothetical protein
VYLPTVSRAPLWITQDRQTHYPGVERRDQDLAAKLPGPVGDRVGVVDRKRDAPVRATSSGNTPPVISPSQATMSSNPSGPLLR